MARTLLALVQTACSEIGIGQPSQLFGSVDDNSLQLIALANREGSYFSQLANKNGGWQALHKEYSFATNTLATKTGNVTQGISRITGLVSTTGITAGMSVSGNGLYGIATVVSIDSASQVTINQPAASAFTGGSYTFGQTAFPMPSDFKYFIDETFWDTAFRWQLLGPLEAQEKNVIKYGISPVGPRLRFWIIGNKLVLNPIPPTGDSVAFDYYSSAFCQSATGTAQSLFAADTDTYVLDEECFIQGMKYRYKQAKGLDFTFEYRDYQHACGVVMGRDGANRNLSINLGSGGGNNLLSQNNFPDTGFGQ